LAERLAWIDLEMTGLDPEEHAILEIASIVTDGDLRVIAEGPDIAIRHPRETLSSMEEWSRVHHEASGLLARAAVSGHDCRSAEEETLAFISRYCDKGTSPLCGNSICQDRRFLARHMPRLEAFFHYRNIDVSSIRYPGLPPFRKKKCHQAMSDIMESLEELRYYREKIFIPGGSEAPGPRFVFLDNSRQ